MSWWQQRVYAEGLQAQAEQQQDEQEPDRGSDDIGAFGLHVVPTTFGDAERG